jgi:DNA-directed RNA polymerase specialized sigma24 family protein
VSVAADWRVRDDHEAMELARRVCTDRQVQVLELRHVYGLSWRMVGMRLGIDESAARGHERRARAKMLKAMEEGT